VPGESERFVRMCSTGTKQYSTIFTICQAITVVLFERVCCDTANPGDPQGSTNLEKAAEKDLTQRARR
jgi:hypothetical protein